MAVIRVNKTADYTVMSNAHFREREMSLKAKGLLSLMLSLPDDWDYSINGLCAICKESATAIRSTLGELERFGYLRRERTQTERGLFDYIYTVFEKPQSVEPTEEKPDAEKPCTENPHAVDGIQENTHSLNTDLQNTKQQKEERKKERNAKSFDSLLDEYAGENQEVRELLGEWLKARKAKRAAMTNKAIELNLAKLDKFAAESGLSVAEYLKEILCKGWAAFYPIKNYDAGQSRPQSCGTNPFLDIAKEEGLF